MTHLIGVSIPRSGHHYLASLLMDILGQDLHYCEFYAPLDCCRKVPCTRLGSARVVFQKNHDSDLRLDASLANCLYVVQTRSPLLEALSDRELAEAVRPELAGDLDDLVVWLGKKAAYYQRFHRKWIAGGPANCIHIPYETLLKNPAKVLQNLLQRAGLSVDPQAVESAVARMAGRHANASGGSGPFTPRKSLPNTAVRPYVEAFAAMLADLLSAVARLAGRNAGGRSGPFTPRKSLPNTAVRPYVEVFAAMLADLLGPSASPKSRHATASAVSPDASVRAALRLATTAHGAAMEHDLPAAAAAWNEFCRQFPGNPYGHVELSRCLEALGEQREALRSALRAARQTPSRLEAVKRARDLLAQSGRYRPAQRLAAAIVQRFPGRPVALIDLAVDLLHSGKMAGAVAAARRFTDIASAAPIESGQNQVWSLRSTAYGFNEPLFWSAACHIFLAGGDAERALDAARFAYAMSEGQAALGDLVARAQQAVDLT